MSGGINWGLLTGIGDNIAEGIKSSRERDIGERLNADDVKGAASIAFKNGNTALGLKMLELANDRAADASQADYVRQRLGGGGSPIFGGGGGGGGNAPASGAPAASLPGDTLDKGKLRLRRPR
jgi:hypothetical protein